MKKMMIEVGGKAYPCRLTMGAMLLFKRNMQKDVSQMTDGNLEEMLMLMWCCIVSASRADGMEFGIDFELFCDMITPEDLQKWNKVVAANNEKKSEEEA